MLIKHLGIILLLMIVTTIIEYLPSSKVITILWTSILTLCSIASSSVLFCFYHNFTGTRQTVLSFLIQEVIIAHNILVVSRPIYYFAIYFESANVISFIEEFPNVAYFLNPTFTVKFYFISLEVFLIWRLFMALAPNKYLILEHEVAGWLSLAAILTILTIDTVICLYPTVKFSKVVIDFIKESSGYQKNINVNVTKILPGAVHLALVIALEIITIIIVKYRNKSGNQGQGKDMFKSTRVSPQIQSTSVFHEDSPQINSQDEIMELDALKMLNDFSQNGAPLPVNTIKIPQQQREAKSFTIENPGNTFSLVHGQNADKEDLTQVVVDGMSSVKTKEVLNKRLETDTFRPKIFTVSPVPADEMLNHNDGASKENLNYLDFEENPDNEADKTLPQVSRNNNKDLITQPISRRQEKFKDIDLPGSIFLVGCILLMYIIYSLMYEDVFNVFHKFVFITLATLPCFSLQKNKEARAYAKLKIRQFKINHGWIDS